MQRRLLAVFAHPDDESFGPGGTLAKYAKSGAEVHILCATRGEAGQQSYKVRKVHKVKSIEEIREKELREAAKVLGVKKVELLDFLDGELSNNKYHDLASKIQQKIESFKPQVIITFDNFGVSGHLDHIAVSLTTTYAFTKQNIAKRLFYYCRLQELPQVEKDFMKRYFVYFPPGFNSKDITTVIDIRSVWEIKKVAMEKHQSQIKDVKRIWRFSQLKPKVENFILFGEKKRAPKEDLFEGI